MTPLTTVDYPGELAAVVFCQGCPWRCSYCHNQHLLPASAPGAVDWTQVLAFLQRRRGLLDAVVFSGGEPTAQHALSDAIDEVHAMGFKIGLHTAGCYPERLTRLLPKVDWVGLDIKALPEHYAALTGVVDSGTRAWTSLQRLLEAGVPHEVRVTTYRDLSSSAMRRPLLDRLRQAGVQRPRLQPCREPSAPSFTNETGRITEP